MNLRSFQAFAEVVRQGGFSAAARTINATQSTVSKAVKQLEEELQLVLLDRAVSPPRLTAAGEIVYRRARAMLTEKDDMLAELGELRGLKRGLLRLGLPPIGSSVLFAPVLPPIRAFIPISTSSLSNMAASGWRSFFWRAMWNWRLRSCRWRRASHGRMCAANRWWRCCPQATPSDDDGVTLREIANLPFILFESGFALNHIILSACQRHGFSPNVAVRSSQIDFIVELVAAGMGIGFLPQMIAKQRHHPGVCIHRVKDADVNWHMAFVWRKGAFLSHAARAWLALCEGASTPAKA